MLTNILAICCLCFVTETVNAVKLVAYFSQLGLHGEIHFNQPRNGENVEIQTYLEATLQYPSQVWDWGIHQFPVDYSDPDPRRRCEDSKVGPNVISFVDKLGYLTLPGNETTTWDTELNITGDNGIWGKSLVLTSETGVICATITVKGLAMEHLAEARFNTPVSGSVYFRWFASKETEQADTILYSNLVHMQNISRKLDDGKPTKHGWKIYATDIFEINTERDENCNILQLVFDPQNKGKGKAIGDIDSRVGKISVASFSQRQEARMLFRDEKLVLLPSDLNGPQRKLYLVIFDLRYPDNFLACAKIRHIKPKVAKSSINGKRIKGDIIYTQRSKFEPTWLNFTISSATNTTEWNLEFARNIASFKINHNPLLPTHSNRPDFCQTSGAIFNPTNVDLKNIPPPGYGTQEQYAVGDLTGKLQSRNKMEYHNFILPGASSELNGIYWDVFLPLQGFASIPHRTLTLQQYNRSNPANITEEISTCSSISLYQANGIYQLPMFTAQVLFRYPIVGRVVLRQPAEEPWEDTAIIFEYLIHADGSTQKNSHGHRWAIHTDPIGKDFYNWTGRCLESGDVYNPYKVAKAKLEEEECTQYSGYCRVGDLWNRVGSLAIAGAKINSVKLSRTMFVDANLPLSGSHNVLGRSFVIYDDHGPKARGERLACSPIGGHFRRKAVARDWHSNGDILTVGGKLEFLQQSEYDLTNVEVNLKGLNANSGYHVHITPVEADLEFPCEGSSLYGHWNPRGIDPKLSPPPANGTTDQYEMGDLSGKFGTLDTLIEYDTFYNDSRLPLFGYESIIGRSIVIHKKEKMQRWACSTLERGYSPSEAREVRAIASFHNPLGFAFGYIRMTQLIGSDNSQSDTIIEIKLRHPGVNDRNLTRNHNWQIFVNPIGVDATVPQTATRCVAGGYVWNPFYTQLADPLNGDLYREECGPDNPLRCYVGDVSSRLGTLDIGDKRIVYTDPNFPLEGLFNAMGRSIVIMGPQRSGERYACANIEPDHYIVKYINIERPPRFVVAQFLEDIRNVLGLPEWMLAIDSRSTKTLHNNACVQMIINFKGPNAHKIELDFTRLLASGRLDAPSIYIPGYINPKRKKSLSYRTCGVRDHNEKNSKRRKPISGASRTNVSTVILFVGLLMGVLRIEL